LFEDIDGNNPLCTHQEVDGGFDGSQLAEITTADEITKGRQYQ
jgi:hypothetical protein